MIYRGFWLWNAEVFEGYGRTRLELDDFQFIKSLGLNTVAIYFMWSYDIEPSRDQPGVYDEGKLLKLERVIDLARQAGLEVMLNMRIQYDPVEMPSWAGWAKDDEVILTGALLDRFLAAWEMIINRLGQKVSAWIPIHVAWHRQSLDPLTVPEDATRISRFYNVFIPVLYGMFRQHTSKPILFDAPPNASWTYDPIIAPSKGFPVVTPLPYSNIIYGGDWAGTCMWGKLVECGLPELGCGDQADLVERTRAVREFAQKYNVPISSNEWGFNIIGCPQPPDPSRLDMFRRILDLLEQPYPQSWLYHVYCAERTQTYSPRNIDGSANEVGQILSEHAPVPAPTPSLIPLIPLGIGIGLILLSTKG